MKLYILALAVAVVLTGCASPGVTKFSAQGPNGKKVEAVINGEISAKDLAVDIDVNAGTFSMRAGSWSSRKQGVIEKTYKGQTLIMDATGRVVGVVAAGVIQGMGKAVLPIP